MALKEALFRAVYFSFIFATVYRSEAASNEHSTREKRAAGSDQVKNETGIPILSMEINFVNVSDYLRHGEHYGYTTTLKHSEHPFSAAGAKGVHVTWMLASFTKFLNLVSFTGPISPKIVQRDDSVTFKLDKLDWGAEFSFSFKVEFDSERSLKPANYSIVTPVQLLYYDEYRVDDAGVVVSKGQYYSHPLDKVAFDIELPGCSEPLGIKSGKIKDYQITASSSYPDSRPSKARETEDGWCAIDEDSDQYIQIDFFLKTRVTRVGVLRRNSKNHWVTKYSLQYSDDDITWTDYIENGHVKVFKGPQDSDDKEMIIQSLRHPIEANSIRLRPVKWEEQICLRMELYGCDITGSPTNCFSALGLDSGEIKDEALTQSFPSDDPAFNVKPIFIRLNADVIGYPFGWQPKTQSVDYVQIDFGSLKKVTRVATKGGTNIAFYVSKFKLEYSNNTRNWTSYRDNEDIRGPQDRYEAKFPVFAKLSVPFVARYVRIIPNSFGSMRAELYGCSVEELPPYNDAPEYARRSFLLDQVTGRFYPCMYTADELGGSVNLRRVQGLLSLDFSGQYRTESSCVSTRDGKEWTSIKPTIISVVASNPAWQELYGLDRRMNMYRSRDSGDTWQQITDGYIKEIQKATGLVRATPLPENLVSNVPTANFTAVANSTGFTWGVSGSGIHVMDAGSNYWRIVGVWKCCD